MNLNKISLTLEPIAVTAYQSTRVAWGSGSISRAAGGVIDIYNAAKHEVSLRIKNQAATKIQAAFRGHKDRRTLKEKHKAATKIQAAFRGFLGRKDTQLLVEEKAYKAHTFKVQCISAAVLLGTAASAVALHYISATSENNSTNTSGF